MHRLGLAELEGRGNIGRDKGISGWKLKGDEITRVKWRVEGACGRVIRGIEVGDATPGFASCEGGVQIDSEDVHRMFAFLSFAGSAIPDLQCLFVRA